MIFCVAQAPTTVSVAASAEAEGKKRVATEVITIDSDDDSDDDSEWPEQELARLRKEIIALKKIKVEPGIKVEGKLGDERKLKTESREAKIILIDD